MTTRLASAGYDAVANAMTLKSNPVVRSFMANSSVRPAWREYAAPFPSMAWVDRGHMAQMRYAVVPTRVEKKAACRSKEVLDMVHIS
jgi:hypothetical protein